MAQLPIIKRFSTEDFPTQAEWIGTLFYPLNLLLTTLAAAFSNGFTVAENMRAQVKTVSMSGDSPTVSFPYKFAPAQPIGVLVINVVQTNAPAVALSAAVGCTYTMSNGLVTATVQGLDAGQSYNVTFYVIGG